LRGRLCSLSRHLFALDDAQDEKLQAVQDSFSDEVFSTVEIEGVEYVLLVTPFDR
jgi:hypothetical protein